MVMSNDMQKPVTKKQRYHEKDKEKCLEKID